ncbi:MAG: helix-turn-helix domain-containing protein [Candidatus Izemoplasmataceae bacterium]
MFFPYTNIGDIANPYFIYFWIQLADLVGVTDKAVSKWENDGGMPEITILPSLAKVLNVTTDFLLTGTDNTKPLSPQEMCAKNDDLELYNELKKKNLFAKDETNNDLWYYTKKYKSLKIAMQIFQDGNLIRFLQPKDYRKYRYTTLRKIPDILIDSAHNNQNYSIFDAFEICGNHISSLPLDHIIDKGFESKKFNQSLFDWLMAKKKDGFWTIGITRMIEVLVERKESTQLNSVLDFCVENNQQVFSEQEKIQKQNHGRAAFSNGNLNTIMYNHRKIGQYFVIPESVMKVALKNNMISEVKKMNQINQNTVGRNAYIMDEFEFYKDELDKNNNLSEKQKKLKEITYNDIVVIDELIQLDDPKLYKEYIELPASIYEKGFMLIENENFRDLLKLAVEIDFKEVVRKIDTFDKITLQTIWAKEIRKNYKKNSSYNEHKIGSKDSLLKKSDSNSRYYILEPSSILFQSASNIYAWLKECKYKIVFKKIINHKNKFFFNKAIEFDNENIDWALENVNPKRFEIIKLLLDNGAQLHKRWEEDDGWGYMQQRDEIDKIGTEVLRKQIDNILEGKNE